MEQIKYIMWWLIFLLTSITINSQELPKTDLLSNMETLLNGRESIKQNRKDHSISFVCFNASAKYENDAFPIRTNTNTYISGHSSMLNGSHKALVKADELQKIQLRTNLLHWTVLVPNIGIEYYINPRFSVQANTGWTHFIWKNRQHHYRFYYVNAEARYYFLRENNGYIGAALNMGQFNFKFKDTGRQGDIIGANLSGGYILVLNPNFDIDFGVGLGYLHANYEEYIRQNGRYKLLEGNLKKHYWGITQISIGLIWKVK